MTPAQLRILSRTFKKIEPQSDEFGIIFYERLFEIAPELRPMFGTDIKLQQTKFMKVIKEVVHLHLRSLVSLPVMSKATGSAVIPGAFWSGKLHAAFGVKLKDYETMKEALLWAVEQILGNECTHEVSMAWADAYDVVAGAMREGMLSPEDEDTEPENDMRLRLNAEKPMEDTMTLRRSSRDHS